MKPLRLGVTATLSADGDRLTMSTTRPGGIPQLDANGWPAIVTGLQVADAEGRAIETTPLGEEGWRLARPSAGRVTLRYEVDYSLLSELNWPAPRESAYADAANIVLAGRSVFITTPKQTGSTVSFDAPPGWHVATPWPTASAGKTRFRVGGVEDLIDNLLVISRARPDVVVTAGLTIGIVAIGPWEPMRGAVRRLIDPLAKRYAGMMPLAGHETYLMVLLPHKEDGGESFRNSFAMNLEDAPTLDNRPKWGNTLAHELFHYWNGWRLRGSDYAASQWFQEGFTEYVANKSLLSTGLITPTDFLQRLSQHVAHYRKLETSLDAPGTRKGRPLYGGGALTALCWDVLIRQASDSDRNLDEVMAELWRSSQHGARQYEWQGIRMALDRTERYDWDGFHRRHIQGREPLPIDAALHSLGLRLDDDGTQGQPIQVLPDPDASQDAQALWKDFIAR